MKIGRGKPFFDQKKELLPPSWFTSLHRILGQSLSTDFVVVLSLTVEWGVGMERQGPSYGEVVSTKDVRVQALLGGSNSPTSRSPEAVEWIMSI